MWLALYLPAVFATLILIRVVVNPYDAPAPLPSEISEATSGYEVIVCLGLVVQVVAMAVWLVRAYGNLRCLGTRPLRPNRWLVAVVWVVPIVNIVVATRVLRDLWRGSARCAFDNPHWRRFPVPSSLTCWWLTYCLAIVGAFAIVEVVRPEEVGRVSAAHWLAYAHLLLLVLTARAGRRLSLTHI